MTSEEAFHLTTEYPRNSESFFYLAGYANALDNRVFTEAVVKNAFHDRSEMFKPWLAGYRDGLGDLNGE